MKNNVTIFSVLLLLACSIIISSGCNKNNPADTVMTDNTETSNSNSDAVTTEDAKDESVIIDDESSYKISRNDCTTFIDPQGYNAEINTFVYLQGLVEITNTGKTDLELSAGSLDINNNDEPFILSEVFTGHPQIISPGEKGYYYYVKATDNATLDGNYTIVPNVSVKKSLFSNIKLDVTEASLTQDQIGNIKITGRIKNNTQDEQTNIVVVAILYDSNLKPITILLTHLDISAENGVPAESVILAPGDETSYEATGSAIPNTVTPDSVACYVVYAYPYQFEF